MLSRLTSEREGEVVMRLIEGEMTCDPGFLVLPECLDKSFESRTACYAIKDIQFDPVTELSR
jgi:hypothetical protein